MSKPDLAAALRAGRSVVAPGNHGMIAGGPRRQGRLRLSSMRPGFWLTASAFETAQRRIATYTQMFDRVRPLCARSRLASSPTDIERSFPLTA